MGLFEHFPYTNFHELNLTWFLDTFRELLTEWEEQKVEFQNLKDAWEAMQQWITDYFDNLDVQEEINNKLNAMAASGELSVLLSPFIPDLVTAWLDANVTPTTPIVDDSFTIEDAAADSKAVGVFQDAFIGKAAGEYGYRDIGTLTEGSYISVNTGGEITSANWDHTPFYPVRSKALLIHSPVSSLDVALAIVSAVAFYTGNRPSDFISGETIIKGADGDSKWICVQIPDGALMYRCSVYHASASDFDIIEIPDMSAVDDMMGVFYFTANFGTIQQVINSGIPVKAGTVYRIYPIDWNGDPGAYVYAFSNGSGGSSKYVRFDGDTPFVDFNCTIDGYLVFYNVHLDVPTMTVKVLENAAYAVDRTPIEYYVSKSNVVNNGITARVRDSESLTELLLDLKDDAREKTIFITGGEYDIWQEYQDLITAGRIPATPSSGSYNPSTGYEPYCVFVPENTHIIGLGNVRLMYAPNAADTYVNESKTLSPINIKGSVTLENVAIYCKNGRYCIHDDPLQAGRYNRSIKHYKNLYCVKGANDSIGDDLLGTSHVFGSGIAREELITIEDSYFENLNTGAGARNVYFHNRGYVDGVNLTEEMSSHIVIKNCIMKVGTDYTGIGLFLANIPNTSDQLIRVEVENCWTNGSYYSADEASWTSGDNPNTYMIKVLNGMIYGGIIIRDASNQYPEETYNVSNY